MHVSLFRKAFDLAIDALASSNDAALPSALACEKPGPNRDANPTAEATGLPEEWATRLGLLRGLGATAAVSRFGDGDTEDDVDADDADARYLMFAADAPVRRPWSAPSRSRWLADLSAVAPADNAPGVSPGPTPVDWTPYPVHDRVSWVTLRDPRADPRADPKGPIAVGGFEAKGWAGGAHPPGDKAGDKPGDKSGDRAGADAKRGVSAPCAPWPWGGLVLSHPDGVGSSAGDVDAAQPKRCTVRRGAEAMRPAGWRRASTAGADEDDGHGDGQRESRTSKHAG
jgi:hypothetical protein